MTDPRGDAAQPGQGATSFSLAEEAHPDDPARDMELSRALLDDVAAGRRGPTARVYRPGPTVAFGRLDELRTGYEAARAAATAAGFAPVRRLAGGYAAAYHHGCVVVELATPEASITAGLEERYERCTRLVADVLRGLGVPAEIGELAGEFCAGRYSVHAAGRKLAGVAQRSIKGASLVSAFVAVEDGEALREVLVPVYRALDRAWDPRTAGAAADVVPGLRAAAVRDAMAEAVLALAP